VLKLTLHPCTQDASGQRDAAEQIAADSNALTFKDFVPRLELLTLLGIFRYFGKV